MSRALFPTLALLAVLMMAVPAGAVEPAERLADPALEGRARDLSKELRCLVCQNQSIDDSNAPLAKDLRVLVRERLSAGDTDAEVLAFVTARYGDFVLLRPPFQANTYILWLAPAALLACGVGVVAVMIHRRQRAMATPEPLTKAERKRVASLLDRD